MTTLTNRMIGSCMILILLMGSYACSSSTWEDARQSDTYEAYQAYIKAHPDGKHLEDAKKRAEQLLWAAAKEDTTAESIEKYLTCFPEGEHHSKARAKLDRINSSTSPTGRITGSSVIIRSDHSTESPSVGVVAKEGTEVSILKKFNSSNSNEAILEHKVTIKKNGKTIHLSSGKAVSVLKDLKDSVRIFFRSSTYGNTETTISKGAIEAIGGEEWYKVNTTDDITGWIYGKFVEEI